MPENTLSTEEIKSRSPAGDKLAAAMHSLIAKHLREHMASDYAPAFMEVEDPEPFEPL
jgi:hypothetical protein